MSKTIVSYIVHALAGAAIVFIPLLIAGIPESIQAMTVGGVLGLVLKFAHDIAGL